MMYADWHPNTGTACPEKWMSTIGSVKRQVRWSSETMSLPTAVGVDQMIFKGLFQSKQSYQFYDFLFQHRKPKISWIWLSKLPLKAMCCFQIFFSNRRTLTSQFFSQKMGQLKEFSMSFRDRDFLIQIQALWKKGMVNCYVQRLTFPTCRR